MIKRFNIFIFILFFFTNLTIAKADNEIRFVDIDFIYTNSVAGKKANSKILDQSKNISDELQNFQKTINDEKAKLINQKNILAKDEYQKQSLQLEKKISEYNKILSVKNNKLQKLKNDVKIDFSNKLNNILQEYAKNNSINMILDKKNILIGKNNLDVTEDILDLFNKNIKEIKIK